MKYYLTEGLDIIPEPEAQNFSGSLEDITKEVNFAISELKKIHIDKPKEDISLADAIKLFDSWIEAGKQIPEGLTYGLLWYVWSILN